MGIPIKVPCSFCKGIGNRYVGPTGAGQPAQQLVACSECGGTGFVTSEQIEDTFDDAILVVLAAQDIEIADIKSKCNHIKNKVDDIKDLCQSIWDKLNV
jgi:hypothetical protein